MTDVLIARMNVPHEHEAEFNSWYNGPHLEQASGIPGFGSHHIRYKAAEFDGQYWKYRAWPEYTAIYEIKSDADVGQSIASDQYHRWSGDFLERWRERTSDEVSILCRQIFGPDGPPDYEAVLIAQMNVGREHEDEFHEWYNNVHLPQASAIPGFGSRHRRYEAFEASGPYWDYHANPRFTSLYEIQPNADILTAINSDEYREWSGDFLQRWRERTTDEVSTICFRVRGGES